MYNRFRMLWQRYRHIVIYLVFGAVVTITNFAVYLPLHNWLHLSATVSNCLAWVVAVLVAFVTNKPFVFQSHDWSWKTVTAEFSKFVSCRLASGVAETLILLLTVDLLRWDGNLMKILTSVFVVVANYVGSKWLVFKGK